MMLLGFESFFLPATFPSTLMTLEIILIAGSEQKCLSMVQATTV